MVRIHVVRASRLLLGAGIAVLLAVVLWLAGRALLGGEETGESPRMDRMDKLNTGLAGMPSSA